MNGDGATTAGTAHRLVLAKEPAFLKIGFPRSTFVSI
jgi:hypothetical protein